jgi:hypothetical protein
MKLEVAISQIIPPYFQLTKVRIKTKLKNIHKLRIKKFRLMLVQTEIWIGGHTVFMQV